MWGKYFFSLIFHYAYIYGLTGLTRVQQVWTKTAVNEWMDGQTGRQTEAKFMIISIVPCTSVWPVGTVQGQVLSWSHHGHVIKFCGLLPNCLKVSHNWPLQRSLVWHSVYSPLPLPPFLKCPYLIPNHSILSYSSGHNLCCLLKYSKNGRWHPL